MEGARDEQRQDTACHVVHTIATHALLYKRYVGGRFEQVGEASENGRVDPETGGKYTAIQSGGRHTYSTDLEVGSSYPETVFVFATGPDGESVAHEQLESSLRLAGLWNDAYERVVIPRGRESGEPTWWCGFKQTPPESGPMGFEELAATVRREVGSEEMRISGRSVEAFIDPSGD